MIILCTVDITTREVTIPSDQRIASYDHKVDVIRFQVETIPGFSLDTSSIKIAAQGPNKARHDYAVDPATVAIEEETGYITFDWPIPAGVTEMPEDMFGYGSTGQLIFAVCAEIISGSTVSKAWHSDDGIITVVAHLEPEAGGGEDPSETATNAQKIAQLQTDVAVMNTQIGALGNGSPAPVATVAEMTDESAVYLYTGSETGYTAGNWYYYNGSAWTSGGTYGGAVTSTTFNQHGVPADDFAVGQALAGKADSADVTALEGSVEAIADALEDKADKSDLDNLDMVQIADDFSASKTYAIGDYAVYNKKLYRCITAITTAGAWDSSKWTEISVMGDLGDRLDMLVTMQEIREEDEPTSEIVQLIDPEWIAWQTVSTQHRANIFQRIPLKGNGVYYDNPYRAENTDPTNLLVYPKFYNAFGELITFTKQGATETRTSFTFFSTYGCRFEISDGNVLSLYVRGNELNGVWVGDSEIAYMGEDAGNKIYFGLTEERNVGITYGGYSTTYVPYEGSAPVITHEYQYVPAMAEYVQRYMQIYGTAASNSMYKRYYPDEDKTLAVNAFRYWHDRAERENRGVIRVANFNKFVSRQSGNWSVIKQELADYSVDICGFQEATNILNSDGKRIEEFMLGYQFTGGSDFSFETYNFNNGAGPGKAIISHWTVTDTDVFTLVTTDSAVVQSAVRCIMTIPSGKWFSNYVNSGCTLSVYSWHGISTNATIGGVTKTSLEIRQMEINALLAIMAQDTSDFIVVVADTNCFEGGLDVQTNTHVEWEMFRTAGYTPILPGIESTVTGNVAASHFHIDGNGTAFCDACYDQIFVSSHITADDYKVVDSNLYPVPAASNAPVSDHCMIYADLKFDFDAVMQGKLIEKMGVTT